MATLDAAAGHWPRLLMGLGGLAPDQLTNRHQSCPSCTVQGIALGHGRNVDRYRWDNDNGPGGWYCSQCGGKDGRGGAGSGLDLLMRVRGWDLKQACQAVERHLGIEPTAPATRSKRRHRIPDKPPADAAPPALGRAVAQWCYRDAAGEQLYWIQRIPQPPKTEGAKPGKLFVHRTWLDGQWHYPSRRDGFASEWPAPRPVYRLPDLTDRPDAPVLIGEGEGKTDAATELFPDHVCIGWTGGTAGINHTDWRPLAGRTVILWPDNDDKGRSCMATLGERLLALGCLVTVVRLPDGVPAGWDLADALRDGWTSGRAAKAVATYGRVLEPPAPPAVEPAAPVLPAEPPAAAPPAGGQPFHFLGFDDGGYFYQPGNTGQVVRLSRASHTATNLLQLAPIAYWETLYPSKTGVNWQAAASALFVQQAAVGIYSPDRIRGRGAWCDDGRSVLHLGDRLLVDEM